MLGEALALEATGFNVDWIDPRSALSKHVRWSGSSDFVTSLNATGSNEASARTCWTAIGRKADPESASSIRYTGRIIPKVCGSMWIVQTSNLSQSHVFEDRWKSEQIPEKKRKKKREILTLLGWNQSHNPSKSLQNLSHQTQIHRLDLTSTRYLCQKANQGR